MRGLAVLALSLVVAPAAGGQVKPNADWRTLRTQHFYVHFTPPLDSLARRTATHAESAYVKLSQHLTPPRGMIDLVISDDVDYANGSATPVPGPRIVLYANPPVFESALRFVDDPMQLVVTHELTHIFQLDRATGIWGGLQKIFGRVPLFFPNAFQPSWFVEGLAVYYESLLTGSGRILGSEHSMIARASVLEHAMPRLDQLSLARPHFPYGSSAYVYGSLFVDDIAKRHGDRAIRAFVESSSRQLIPVLLDFPARRAFGHSFTKEYQQWTQALVAKTGTAPDAPPMPGWRTLTTEGAFAAFPRWVGDTALVYAGTNGRESFAAHRITLDQPPRHERLGRRSARAPNSVLPDGSLVFSQFEFTSPYELRNDLYKEGPGGLQRLTHGARLADPDARADGRIVAVQTLPGGTRLALASSDGSVITPLTTGSADEQWSEPRWSPDGRHVAASRWTRGGTSEIVVVDTAGHIAQSLIRERAVASTPGWSRDGRYVYFTSDRDGIPNVYRAAFRPAFADTMMVPDLQRVSSARTGLFEASVSPSGSLLAAVVFKSDGYHVGVAPLDSVRGENAPMLASVAPREPAPVSPSTAPARRYSAWRSVRPRFWLPVWEDALDSSASRIGAFVSSLDVMGRHMYDAEVLVPTDNSGITGTISYVNATLGQPQIGLSASQDWTNRGCILNASNACVGVLRRRIRDGNLAFIFQRPRVRSFAFASVGAGFEARDYATDPTPLLSSISSYYQSTHWFPRATLSAGWSNLQRPELAISPEDGVAFSATSRVRWVTGDVGAATVSTVGSASAYKSVPLPGFAHHVIAARVAGGVQDSRGTGYYEVGGVSGSLLDVLGGYTLGEGRRTFAVRGFDAASLNGIYAATGSAEWRAPFRLPGRGLGTLPLFLDRLSVTAFADAGTAWCPRTYALQPLPRFTLCTASDSTNGFVLTTPRVIGSVGAELNLSAAILSWDQPFLYRFGFAAPVMGTQYVPGAQKPRAYLTVGASF